MSANQTQAQAQQRSDLPSVDDYAAILEEAKAIRGVSLWRDAWRQLRKNKVAIASMCFLLLITGLAFLTPLLPLQSPMDKDLRLRQFLPPNTHSIEIGSRKGLGFEDGSLVAELAKYDKMYDEAMPKLKAKLSEAKEREKSEDDKERRAELTKARKSVEGEIDELKGKHPFGKLWNKPGVVTRFLIRIRLSLFGEECIPSLCGTDELGRDVLARVFWGARVSLAVGVVATCVSLLIGVSWGAIAGYFGGWLDSVMMRIVDVLYSVPFVFVVIFIITILRDETVKQLLAESEIDQIMVFFILIGAIYWLTMSRVVRGQIISLKHEQFIDAARTIGASRLRIVFRHLIPNVMGVVIVYLTLTIPAVMLFEAFLSFLGLGVERPDVSWGLLVNEGIGVITPIKIYWWLVLFPGLTLTLTLFALNFLGDGLRDALDPRMKNR